MDNAKNSVPIKLELKPSPPSLNGRAILLDKNVKIIPLKTTKKINIKNLK